MKDFSNIEYLQSGNTCQKRAYSELNALNIFDDLKEFDPLLTGTIPIEINIPGSDLDIICKCQNHVQFSRLLVELYSNKNEFEIETIDQNGIKSTVAKFKNESFDIEIFGQDIPTKMQNAYQHMIVEYEILNRRGATFKAEIIKLKESGIKTEPAFAKKLGLLGDPYVELLNYKENI